MDGIPHSLVENDALTTFDGATEAFSVSSTSIHGFEDDLSVNSSSSQFLSSVSSPRSVHSYRSYAGPSQSQSKRNLALRSVESTPTGKIKRRRHRQNESSNGNFKVVVRVRPPLPRELESILGFKNAVKVAPDGKTIYASDGFSKNGSDPSSMYNVHSFTFDHVYPERSDQLDVYETTARDAVLSSLQGYNATIMAYGQTSAGKTYTMEGFDSSELRGIIPRAIDEIFQYIETRAGPTMRFLVRASYLQIYNDVISDLLKTDRTNLQIREDKRKGLYVGGLSEWVVRSPAEIYGLIRRGSSARATSATKLNEISSRSHAIFVIIVEQNELTLTDDTETNKGQLKGNFKVGKLNLVDLAGSERVRVSGASGARLKETQKINQSLSALGNVISALTEHRTRRHIPYRNSKLTRILEDSLGGNCKTTMMAMVSPALEHFTETLSTLKFANRAKNIKNVAQINEDLNEKALLRRYERELKRLRAELNKRSKNVVDKRRLLELEDQRNRALRDKMAAIYDLERLSADLMREKAHRKKLMKKIKQMSSQLLVGGHRGSVEDLPEFRNALQKEQERIRKTYTAKMEEMEKERGTIEQDKAQVERYKQLLVKQRDIMIQLTARLNERDQSILALQDELDAYDRQQRKMEDELDQKTVQCIQLQRLAVETTNETEESGEETNVEADEKVKAKDVEEYENRIRQLEQEVSRAQADRVSFECLMRDQLEEMVVHQIEDRVREQQQELAKWKKEYSAEVKRRKNAEYIVEMSKVGNQSETLQKQLNSILERERSRVEQEYEVIVQNFRNNVANKEEELKEVRTYNRRLVEELQRQGENVSKDSNQVAQTIKELQTAHNQVKAEKEALRVVMQHKVKQSVESVLEHFKQTNPSQGTDSTISELTELQKIIDSSLHFVDSSKSS